MGYNEPHWQCQATAGWTRTAATRANTTAGWARACFGSRPLSILCCLSAQHFVACTESPSPVDTTCQDNVNGWSPLLPGSCSYLKRQICLHVSMHTRRVNNTVSDPENPNQACKKLFDTFVRVFVGKLLGFSKGAAESPPGEQ